MACASVPSWDVPWLLLLLLIAGQGITIIALSIVLWRRRGQASRDRGESFPRDIIRCERGWAHIQTLASVCSRVSKGHIPELSGDFCFPPEPSVPRFKPEVQVYENIHLAHLR